MFNKKPAAIQRKAILMGKELEKKKQEETNEKISKPYSVPNVARKKVIALTGTQNGVGCTHISLALAYRLSQEHDVALVELDKKNDLKGFEYTYELKPGKIGSKKLGNLDVYFYEPNKLIEILKQEYEYIFLDIGRGVYVDEVGKLRGADFLNEAYRADIKFVITNTKEWQQKYLADFIKYDGTMNDWIILANMASKEEEKELEDSIKGLSCQVKRIPFFEGVFDIKAQEFNELISLLCI